MNFYKERSQLFKIIYHEELEWQAHEWYHKVSWYIDKKIKIKNVAYYLYFLIIYISYKLYIMLSFYFLFSLLHKTIIIYVFKNKNNCPVAFTCDKHNQEISMVWR